MPVKRVHYHLQKREPDPAMRLGYPPQICLKR